MSHIDWYCPSCGETKQTKETVFIPGGQEIPIPNVYHACPKMAGLTTPFVRKGIAAKHERVMREDYVGDELVRRDDEGRVVMSIVTTREEGQDVTVFAPTATAFGRTQEIE